VSKVIEVRAVPHPASVYTPTLNALIVPLVGIVLVDVISAKTLATIIIAAIDKATMTVLFCIAIIFRRTEYLILSHNKHSYLEIRSQNQNFNNRLRFKCGW
jgi:hypothetical protein